MFTVWRRKFDELLSYSQFWLRYGCRAWDISDVCGRGCDDSSWSTCVYVRTSNMCVLHNVCTIYICKGEIEFIFKCLPVSCQIDTNTYIRYIYTYNIMTMYLYTYKCNWCYMILQCFKPPSYPSLSSFVPQGLPFKKKSTKGGAIFNPNQDGSEEKSGNWLLCWKMKGWNSPDANMLQEDRRVRLCHSRYVEVYLSIRIQQRSFMPAWIE